MVSIVMPTYNRFDIAKETIQKIISITDTDILFELIVVNDGDPLSFKLHHESVSYLINPKKGVASARNFGASKAKYPILFFIDDDMWPTNESLEAIRLLNQSGFFKSKCLLLNWKYPEELITAMKRQKIGRYLLNANYETLEGRLKLPINKSETLSELSSIGSGSLAIGKDVFNYIGQYNDKIVFQGEDVDLYNKTVYRNISVYLYTKITCFHNQKDRLVLCVYLDREYRGYASQFKSKIPVYKKNVIKEIIYTFLIPFYPFFLLIYALTPNSKFFDTLTFRTIGTLSSIKYYTSKHIYY